MNGEVTVESVPGKGSTFYFTARLETSGKTPVKPLPPQSMTGKKILIADDNINNLEILEYLLEAAGMEVTAVTLGAEVLPALRAAKEEDKPFDLCILDMRLPDTSGIDVARQIRQPDSPDSTIKLLAFTSMFPHKSRDYKDSGFDGFLPKSVLRAKLYEMLERLLLETEPQKTDTGGEPIVTRHSIVEEAKHALRILLVEDNPINQKLAYFLLSKAGYHVEMAVNGKEAVETYTGKPGDFDIIFMDIQMPEMDGLEATRLIREQGFSDIPIIAMTAQAMKGDREKCMEAGMNDYIPKPIKRELVFEMVKKWAL
jgi:CheY-like chemotaxis protein